MRPFVENFPFFCVFLSMTAAILLSVIHDGRAAFRLSLAVAGAVAALSAAVLVFVVKGDLVYTYVMGRFGAPFGNELKVGPVEALLTMCFALVMLLSLLGGREGLFHDILPEKQHLYFVMTNLILASLLALTYTNDLFTGYVFIEVSTIAACSLVMAKDTGPNLMATLRYLFLSLMGSGLFLVGVTMLYGVTGHLLMPYVHDVIAGLVRTGDYRLPLAVSIGLITVGLGVKSAMFPFHLWLPDAHGSANTTSSAILSGLVLKGYIVLLMTLYHRVFTLDLVNELHVTDVVLAFGLMGMIFGSLQAMRQTHIKRMLAYSSVAQVGYIFMGVGLGTEAGLVASCLHVLVHAFSKPMLFCCAGRLSNVAGRHKNMANLHGTGYRSPIAGVGFTVGALSMIGIPLLGGFASKLYFANASLLRSDAMLATLLVLGVSTVLNALYYVPAVIAIWSPSSHGKNPLPKGLAEPDPAFILSTLVSIAAVFVLGIFYQPISSIIEASVRLI